MGVRWRPLRSKGASYEAFYDKVALEMVANSVRHVPKDWVVQGGADVTDDFVHYAMPLIGEGAPVTRIENRFQRFARLHSGFIG